MTHSELTDELKKFMDARALTQEELAKLLRVSQPLVSKILSGRAVSPATLRRVRGFLSERSGSCAASIPTCLVDRIVAGRMVPFLGPGIRPLQPNLNKPWHDVLELVASRLEDNGTAEEAQVVRFFVKRRRLLEATEEALTALGTQQFLKVLSETLRVSPPEHTELPLANALWALRPSVIVTTNYDDVLCWANPTARMILNDQKAELAELYRTATADSPWVWHLHGHISRADSLILGPAEYDAFYRDRPQTKRDYEGALLQLRNLVSNHSLLFAGFSLSDQYAMDLLMSVLDTFGDNLRSSYALLKTGEQSAEELWKRYNIRTIEFADVGPPLVERVQEIVRRAAESRSAGTAGGKAGGPLHPVPVVPPAYTEWLKAICGDIDLLGLRAKHGLKLTLSNVYVPLRSSTKESLLDLLDHDSLYVSGPPGTGKSTFCRWSAWLACSGEMPAHEIAAEPEFAERYPASFRRRLPVLIRLRDFWTALPDRPDCQELSLAEFEAALEHWVEARKPGGLTWPLLHDHLERGSALVLLDGLDEVPLVYGAEPTPHRPRSMILSGLAAAVAAWGAVGNRILATSRPYGMTLRDQQRIALRHAAVAELPDPTQRLLVRRWFRCLGDDAGAAETLAREMLDHLRERPEIAELAANPMLLTAMCIMYQEGKRLPQDKYDLYDRITDTVLCNRYPNDPTQVDLVRNRLCVVAYGMHTGYGLGEQRATPLAATTHYEIDHMIRRYRDDSPGTEREFHGAVAVREDLLTRSGILLPREGDRAAFYHLTFQDFLAAQRLLDLEGERLLEAMRERAEHPDWRSTLSFLFSSLLAKSSSPDRAIRLLSSVIEGLQPPADRLAIVAADCLEILWGRGAGLRPEDDQRLREYCLQAIDREAPIKERFELGLALGRLGDPRIVADLRDGAAYVEIPAGKYLIGDNRKNDYFEYMTPRKRGSSELEPSEERDIQTWAPRSRSVDERHEFRPLDEEEIEISRPFCLSRFPVTNAQYRMFLDEEGYDDRRWWSDDGWRWRESTNFREPGYWRDAKRNRATQPVVGISHWEAEAFCRWAGGRLPTEREWEAAARGPEALLYPWGSHWEDGICNSDEAHLGHTSAVGIFSRSRSRAFGLEDMGGNVWEWCSDSYSPQGTSRVLRGGSFRDDRRYCRAPFRYGDRADLRFLYVGFRVCCSGVRTLT